MINNTVILSVTGHRKQKLGIGSYFDTKAMKLREIIKKEIHNLLDNNSKIITRNGLCQGADLLFADVCMDILEENPTLNLEIELWYPCNPYNTRLTGEDAKIFKRLTDAKLKSVYVSKSRYFRGCEDQRDFKMVETSDKLLALVDGTGFGGAYRTIASAKQTNTNIKIFNITNI